MAICGKTLVVCLMVINCVFVPAACAYVASACGGCDAGYFYTCAQAFCNKIDSYPCWSQSFCQGCAGCSENYYKSAAVGGSENLWIDSGDIHFRNSHCTTAWDSYWSKNLSGIPCTNGVVTPGEARNAWGDNQLEWFGCKCCQLLRDDSEAYWATAMNGLHLLLGYKTSSYGATDFGAIWADKMRQKTIKILWMTITIPAQTVTQAWFSTTDQTQPKGTVARVLAETQNCFNDHLWGNGTVSADPVPDKWYWSWDHSAGSPEYERVNNLESMYVYKVVQRDVNELYVKSIATAYGMELASGELLVGEQEDSFVVINTDDSSNTRVLEVFKASGQYSYRELGVLWRFVQEDRSFNAPRADGAARGFLSERSLLPSDAGRSDVEIDYVVQKSRDLDAPTVPARLAQNACTTIGRQIEGGPGTEVSVAGPGARLKVYTDPDERTIGAIGNWRDVEQAGTVKVLARNDAWDLFLTDPNRIAIAPPEAQFDRIEIKKGGIATQVYYEFAGRVPQSELIPCWAIEVEYYYQGELVTTADAYIPAAPSYIPPLVTIMSPESGASYAEGAAVVFDCFVNAAFGTAPYSYRWESDADGFLSNRKSFTSNALSVKCSSEPCDSIGAPSPHKITVTVTDAKGLESTDTIEVLITGKCQN